MIHAFRRTIFLGSSSAILLTIVLPLLAQGPLQPKDGEEAFLGGLQDKLDPKGEQKRFDELTLGKSSVSTEKENRMVVAKAARWYAFRLTNPKYHGQGEVDEKDKGGVVLSMNDLIKDANKQLFLPRGKKELNDNQKEYLKAFSGELVKCLREVLSRNSKPLVRVNAARMLGGVAEAGQEEVADTLVDIIQNPRESEAVKLYAFRALKELFDLNKPDESIIKDPKREARALLVLGEYVTRKPESLPKAEDEVDALRYVRREAVRALGMSRYALVPKSDKPEGRTAWVLLRVARKDGLTPEPSVSEQVEGAIGACRMRATKDAPVQLDYVAANVGPAVVEFVNQAGRAKSGTGDAGIAWKLYAARLHQALEDLRTRSKEGQAAGVADYVDKLVRQAQDPVRAVWDGKDANPTALDDWLRANPPKSTTVYKGIADSTVGGK
jgi:hypothetical protein